jgi:hypothetical protein
MKMLHARSDYDRIVDTEGLIPEDEPVMLFRAKDVHAPSLLDFYALLLAAGNADPEMIASVKAHAVRMVRWQETNGSKLPDVPAEAIR